MLLRRAGEETRHIDESDDRDIEGVTEAHETRRLDAGVDVQRAGLHRRLIRHDAHAATVQPREADQDVAGPVRHNLKEIAVVHHMRDHFVRIVGLVGFIGDQRVQSRVAAQWVIARRGGRRVFGVVSRQIAEQFLRQVDSVLLAIADQMRHAARRGMHQRPAQVVERDFFARDGFDHLRAGDEHIAALLDHDDEIGDSRRIDRAAGAWPHDQADLRHDARRQGVAQEDIGVAIQAGDALLDTRPARIGQAHDRRAILQCQIHHLADLGGVGFRERPAGDGEILRPDIDQPAIDRAIAADHAIAQKALAVHAEIAEAMHDETI